MSQAVSPADFSEICWRGHWIWAPEEVVQPGGALSSSIDPNAAEAHALFRRHVHLD